LREKCGRGALIDIKLYQRIIYAELKIMLQGNLCIDNRQQRSQMKFITECVHAITSVMFVITTWFICIKIKSHITNYASRTPNPREHAFSFRLLERKLLYVSSFQYDSNYPSKVGERPNTVVVLSGTSLPTQAWWPTLLKFVVSSCLHINHASWCRYSKHN